MPNPLNLPQKEWEEMNMKALDESEKEMEKVNNPMPEEVKMPDDFYDREWIHIIGDVLEEEKRMSGKAKALLMMKLAGKVDEYIRKKKAQAYAQGREEGSERVVKSLSYHIEQTLDSLNGCGIDPKSYNYRLVETWLNNLKTSVEMAEESLDEGTV